MFLFGQPGVRVAVGVSGGRVTHGTATVPVPGGVCIAERAGDSATKTAQRSREKLDVLFEHRDALREPRRRVPLGLRLVVEPQPTSQPGSDHVSNL